MRRDVQKMPKYREKSMEKHTTCHDKSIKMQRCVYGRERDASLEPVEILSGYVTKPSGWQLLGQHMARLGSSRCNTRFVRMLYTENLKLEENLQKNIFS
jgi:hypothetical protein